MTTHHGTRERVSWSVTRNASTLLFGDDEDAARANYERRAKTLHRGETIRLDRVTRVEAWVHHEDVLAERVKDGAA